MATLPEVTARLDADVSGFIRAWNEAGDAAVRNAARIRAAQEGLRDIDVDSSGMRNLNGEMERLARIARQAADSVRELGNSARGAGGSLDQLGERARRAGAGLGGGGGGGGLGGAMRASGAQAKVMAAGVALVASVLPAVAAAALAAGAALQGLGVAGAVIAGGWRGISQAGDRLKASLGGLQKQLESTFRAGLSQEFTKLGQAISGLDGPLTGIARSVVNVVTSFTGWIRSTQGMKEIETMLAGVHNMMQSIAPGAKAAAEAFTGFGSAAAPAMDEIGKAISSVFENLKKVIDKGKETGQLEKAFQAGAEAIEGFGEILAGVVDILIEMAGSGGDNASETLKKLGKAMQDAAPSIGVVFQHLSRLALIIAEVISWFARMLKATEPLTRKIQEFGDKFDEIFKDGKIVEKFGAAVVAVFDKIKETISTAVKDAVQKVKDWWNKTVQDVKDGVKKAEQAVKDWVKKLEQDIKDAVKKAVQAVKDWWKKTVQDVKDGIKKAEQAVKDWAKKVEQDIKDGIDKAVQAVKDWWDDTVQAVKDGAQKVIDEIKGFVEDIQAELDKWTKDMEDAGKNAGDGLDKGLESATNNVVATATAIAKRAMAAIKNTLGIASPSTVFRDEVGAMIPAGIAEGIIANGARVTDAMRRTGLGALGAGKGALGGAGMGRGGQQTLTLHVVGGADSAAGTFIARLAQQGKLKITANAVVGGRR